jgi:hypothetical protein
MSGQVMKNLHKLLLVDGGHDIIPLPYANDWGRVLFAALPLLRPARKVDLLIMADASDDILSNQTRSLGATAIRAKMDGLPFPDISAAQYKQAGYQTVSTFSSSDPNTPTVVYIPGILDSHAQSFSNVFNFRYTPEHIRYLTSITRKQFVDSMPAIKQAIYEAIMKKRATQKISLLKPS